MICLSLTRPTLDAAIADLRRERTYIHLAELRVDLLDRAELSKVASFPARVNSDPELAPLPLVLTVRRSSDGGAWHDTEEQRVSLLRTAAPVFSYVDLEDDLFESTVAASVLAGFPGTPIRSQHRFDGVPADPATELRRMAADGAIAKLAAMPSTVAELSRLLLACRDVREVRRIVIGMGAVGFPTRVLSGRLGGYLSFVSTGDPQAAPGHCTPAELAETYRYGEIRDHASLFAVIGNPVMHSRSPHYHNRVFAAKRLDALYVPVQVDDVDAFFHLARELPIAGFSVTIPHKRSVIPYLDHAEETVDLLGACNTVVQEAGRWAGANTDVPGFWEPLAARLSERPPGGAPLNALVIGAGGAARAVVFALSRAGIRVTVANRTVERARRLLEELGVPEGEAVALNQVPRALSRTPDIIVQSTSVGMHGDGDPLPMDLSGHEIVYDLVYTPPETPLLKRAAGAGCIVISGTEMFDAQARVQSERYCGAISSSPDRLR